MYPAMAALALMASTASAMTTNDPVQEVDKAVHFGIRTGLNVASVCNDLYGDKYGDMQPRLGFHLGVIADVPLVKNCLYVTPGLYLTQKGAKYQMDVSAFATEFSYSHKEESKINPLYLEVPILLSGRCTFGMAQVQLNLGPYIAVGLAGKSKASGRLSLTYDGKTYENNTPERKTDLFKDCVITDPADDEASTVKAPMMRRFDAGLSFGVGVTLARHYYVGIQYELGLVDTYSSAYKSETKKSLASEEVEGGSYCYKPTRNRNFMITVGYNF